MRLFVESEEVILLGDFELVCYTLNNGLRVFSHTRILNIMMADYTNLNLHKHLSVLVPYLPWLFIERKIRMSIVFTRNDERIRGIEYSDFTVLCAAFVKAYQQNKLASRFFLVAILSNTFLNHIEKQQLF